MRYLMQFFTKSMQRPSAATRVVAVVALLMSSVSVPAETTPEVEGLAEFAPAFPALRFKRPLYLVAPPGDPAQVVVLEQEGRVWLFPNRRGVQPDERTLLLDLPARRSGNEEGLLGLAFHPGYAENRRVFIHYSMGRSVGDPEGKTQRGLISRFTANAAGTRIDPASEQVLLEIEQPFRNHNGGMLEFGEDGMLYIGLGDGGSSGDPNNHAQDRGHLLGKILRIDVDRQHGGQLYGVPADNPFIDAQGARPEVWAYGLRNPWRFSFDRRDAGGTGALWVGDVGQNKREEIAVVGAGENHGWRIREGFVAFRGKEQPHPRVPLIDPVADHGRDEARSITGGYVYRGKGVPALHGWYVYGDYFSGKLFAFKPPANASARAQPLVIGTLKRVASFGLDGRGELHACAFDGRIYRLAPAGAGGR